MYAQHRVIEAVLIHHRRHALHTEVPLQEAVQTPDLLLLLLLLLLQAARGPGDPEGLLLGPAAPQRPLLILGDGSAGRPRRRPPLRRRILLEVQPPEVGLQVVGEGAQPGPLPQEGVLRRGDGVSGVGGAGGGRGEGLGAGVLPQQGAVRGGAAGLGPLRRRAPPAGALCAPRLLMELLVLTPPPGVGPVRGGPGPPQGPRGGGLVGGAGAAAGASVPRDGAEGSHHAGFALQTAGGEAVLDWGSPTMGSRPHLGAADVVAGLAD